MLLHFACREMRSMLLIVTVMLAQCLINGVVPNTMLRREHKCGINQLQCNSSSCYDRTHLCDGLEHCDDGTDESTEICGKIPCSEETFRCDYGACIPKSMFCNGKTECADGSDEKPEVCRATLVESSGCKLPPQPQNGHYRLAGCNPSSCQPVPGNSVRHTFLIYSCISGYALSSSETLLCDDDGWSSEFPSCSPISCPPLVDSTREIKCTLNDSNVHCNKTMVPGTRAVVRCEYFYTHVKEFSCFVTVCQPNGKWSRDITPCIPSCGERNAQVPTFIADGFVIRYGEYPWHAGIYVLLEGEYQQFCGGTIISERAVVSAALCFWDEINKRRRDANYKVMVGKYFRDFKIQGSEIYAQEHEVERIVIHNEFEGARLLYLSNIALVFLKDSIQMNAAVRPVCVDFNREYDRLFSPGKMGVVVGRGITEKLKESNTLTSANLKYIATEECEKDLLESFLPFLLPTVFCASYQNGTTACPGDIGSGLASQFRDGLWYLVGVVTNRVMSENSDACNVNKYVLFTRVSAYYDFIENNVSK